jgi:hypothetical protein
MILRKIVVDRSGLFSKDELRHQNIVPGTIDAYYRIRVTFREIDICEDRKSPNGGAKENTISPRIKYQ